MVTALFLAPLLALAAAAPVSDSACAPPVTVTATVTVAAGASAASAASAASSLSCTVITTTVLSTDAAAVSSSFASATIAATNADGASRRTSLSLRPFCRPCTDSLGVNVQLFTGTLGGPPPPVISGAGDRPFSVNGDTFVGSGAALGRSCDVQHNKCANAANSGDISGGVGQCDAQDAACRAANSLKRRSRPGLSPRALDLGSCSDTTIRFEDGLDGRNTAAFVAADQTDFNHGSALNIAVIAGFICQRLGSPCDAPADTQATCSSASAAAVATSQDQAAADVFNGIMGGGGGAADAVATSASASDLATGTVGAVVMTMTSCA